MADIKATTITGTLAVTSTSTATKHISTTAAAAANECVRKTEFDAAVSGLVATSDARLTDARTPSGTASGGEITGTFPNGLVVADRTVNQALPSPANTGSLTQILSWLARAIKAITGTTNWFDTPATDLATTAAHIANTSNPHSVTAAQVGLGSVTNAAQLVAANNLSDLANTTTAHTNLGLGNSATRAVGTGAGTVAAGDDSRLTNARTPTSHASSHHSGGSDPIRLDLLTVGGAVNFGNQPVGGIPTPTTGDGAANKSYVDDAKGLFKCTVATTGNDSLTGLTARDGISLSVGDRIFVRLQTAGTENGIYVAATGAWTRASDADSGTELSSASLVSVSQGTLYEGTVWKLTTAGPITLGTTSLTFTRFPDATGGVAWSGTQLVVPSAGINDTMIGSRTANQALATPATSGTLTQLLSWIAGRIKAIMGTTNWTDNAPTTLATTAAHIASTSNPHSVTQAQVGLSAVTNALQLVAANNLDDLDDVPTALVNLGLGSSATRAVGTTAGTVAAGDDTRFEIKLGNVLWVDAINGNDGTGVRGRVDKSFLTCGAAKTAATTGDTIYVLPGTYNERDLLKFNVSWFFLPGAQVIYSGAGNGGIFDDSILGSNTACGFVRVDGFGVFINSSGGTSPHAFNITKTTSFVYATGKTVNSGNDYAIVQSAGLLVTHFDDCAGGVNISGGTGQIEIGAITGNTLPGLYLSGGNSVCRVPQITGASSNAIKFKNGDHRVESLLALSNGAAALYVEAPTTTQTVRVINATITSVLNTAAGVAVDLNSDNLVLQNCVLISNTTGTPATVSIKAAGAQNLRVYGHTMANLAKAGTVTLLCGTLEVDTDVTF